MAMTRDEYIDVLKKISETGGDTEDMLENLRKLKDDYDEREGMLRELGERKDKTVYTDDDVYDSDGVRWREKYDDIRRKYRDRFFTTEERAISDQREDIRSDDVTEFKTFSELFKTREGNYK